MNIIEKSKTFLHVPTNLTCIYDVLFTRSCHLYLRCIIHTKLSRPMAKCTHLQHYKTRNSLSVGLCVGLIPSTTAKRLDGPSRLQIYSISGHMIPALQLLLSSYVKLWQIPYHIGITNCHTSRYPGQLSWFGFIIHYLCRFYPVHRCVVFQ